jgi:hypothetical protein
LKKAAPWLPFLFPMAGGFSANFDYNITDNLLGRLEARTLRSNDDIFAGKNGTSKDSATFFTTSIIAHF